ncbi:MAG: hypothetical protein HDR10_07690 [Lachnospiraceae bacterium]|nr:hypothetical protein [Lachnospiraceae bacterium]
MADSVRKKGQGKAGVKVFIIGFILMGMIIGFYYYLSNIREKANDENIETTAIQEALLYNFERNYPPTPKEVVKLYGEMTQCFYNEEYTEEEFVQLAKQIQNLYDDELIANKTEKQYIEDLRWDVNNMKKLEVNVSSYAVGASTDVEYFNRNGFRCAKLYCSFTLRRGTQIARNEEVFLLRRDDEGHWKIYGFKLVDKNSET